MRESVIPIETLKHCFKNFDEARRWANSNYTTDASSRLIACIPLMIFLFAVDAVFYVRRHSVRFAFHLFPIHAGNSRTGKNTV